VRGRSCARQPYDPLQIVTNWSAKWSLVERMHIDTGRPQAEKFFKFVLVGIVNTAFGYSVFAAVYLLADSYRIAIVLATVLGIIFNYFTTGRLVFANRGAWPFVPFVVGYVVTCVVNILIVDGLVVIGLEPLLGQAIALPFVAILSYVINDRTVFRRWA
jgi:putative flippase GtrA